MISVIFDKSLKQKHLKRAANLVDKHDFLVNECAERLIERLEGITSEFPTALDFGSRVGYISERLEGKFGVKKVIQAHSVKEILGYGIENKLVCDFEFLPFVQDSFDLIISLLSLHWVNDLPGCLIQLQHALRQHGLFIASVFGGDTLHELRYAMMTAESKLTGKVSPRISPFVSVQDAANLLQRAKFAVPVADTEKVVVCYKDVISLMHDLRGMGEANALIKRSNRPLSRQLLEEIELEYRRSFADEEGLLQATFEVITISGSKN